MHHLINSGIARFADLALFLGVIWFLKLGDLPLNVAILASLMLVDFSASGFAVRDGPRVLELARVWANPDDLCLGDVRWNLPPFVCDTLFCFLFCLLASRSQWMTFIL